MYQFVEYLTEREIVHKAQKGGKAKDEETFAHFASYASQALGNKLDLKSLLTLVSIAQNDPKNPMHFGKASKDLFIENTKNAASKQSYHDMLRMAAFSLAETAKHPEMKDIIKHGFKVEVAGREIYPVTSDWTRQGVPERSITGTGKTDLRIIDLKTGKVAATASMKRGAGQGLSAQPGEAMAVLTSTANKTMKETLGDRSRHPEEYAEVFGILAEFNTILRSTGNIKDKEKRDKAINKVKPQLLKMFENLQDRSYLGIAWRKAIIEESMKGELKFGPGSPGIPSYVLGFGEEDAFFNTMKEYLNVPDEDIMNTPIYFTLPKTKEAKYTVFRTGTIRHVKKKPETKPEAKPEQKARPETKPERPEPESSYAGAGPEGKWTTDAEDAVYRKERPTARTAQASKKAAAEVTKKPSKPGVISNLKAKVKGAFTKSARPQAQPEPAKGRQAAQAKSTKEKFNWADIEKEYTTSHDSVADIASRHGLSASDVSYHAWGKKLTRPPRRAAV